MSNRKTGVTGYIVDGGIGRRVTATITPSAILVLDRTGTEQPIDPEDFGTIWLTCRAVTAAIARAGVEIDDLAYVPLKDIAAELSKDPRAARFTTRDFVAKMDPRHAGQIIAGLFAHYTTAVEKKTA